MNWSYFVNASQVYRPSWYQEVNFTTVNTLPGWAYNGSAIFLAGVGLCGVVANGSVIFFFLKSSMLRTPFNHLLINMIVAEFLIACIGVPIDFVAAYHHGWTMGFHMCVFTGFTLTTTGLVSLQTLMVLSLQRLMSTWWPKQFKGLSMSRVWHLLLFVWLLVGTISIPPLFGWGKYVPETSGLSCAPDWESGEDALYIGWLLVVGFLVPLGVILLSSSLTIWKLRRMSCSVTEKNVRRRSIRRSSKVSVLIVWMNVVFMLCWLPYGLLCVLRFLYADSVVPDGLSVIPMLFAKSSVCWNPVLYIYLNPQFRGIIRSKRSKQFRKRALTLSELKPPIPRRRDVTFNSP